MNIEKSLTHEIIVLLFTRWDINSGYSPKEKESVQWVTAMCQERILSSSKSYEIVILANMRKILDEESFTHTIIKKLRS